MTPIFCCRSLSLSSSLDKLKTEILDLKHTVAESLIQPAKKSIEELQQDLARLELAQIKLDLPSIPSPPLPVGLKAEEAVSSPSL